MFKFLRKHSKWILAIFGTLLMVVFLIPQAIQSLSRSAAFGSATWATVGEDNEEVSAKALQQCQNELRMLQKLQQPVLGPKPMDNPAHWFLLVREADAAGLVGGHWITQMSPEQVQYLQRLVENSDPRFLDQTFAKFYGVARMIGMYQSAAKLSDYRLRARAARQFHSVQARDDLPEPTEEEIVAQFEAFKDVDRATDEKGFGYRLPDRAKIEWLTIPDSFIREMVENSPELDGVALLKHWKRNPANKPFPPVESGQAIPDIVRNDLLNSLVAQKRDAIRKFAADQFIASWRRLEPDNGYLKLPEDWPQRRVDFRVLAERITAEFPGLALPIYEAIGDRWLTERDITLIDAINMAWTDKYGENQRPSPAQLVAKAKEFGGDPIILIQEGVTGPPLRTTDNSIVFFRITDTDPSRPPHDLEEVRDEVVADLKRQADYEQLRRQVDSIETMAKEEGLLSVALTFESVVLPKSPVHIDNTYRVAMQLQTGTALEPAPSSLPLIGPHMPTIETIIDRALSFPLDKPLRDIPAEQRTFVVPVDEKLAIMVVELVEQYPLDRQRFSQLVSAGLLQRLLLGEELEQIDGSVQEAFSFETMVKRHNFKVKRRQTEEDEAEEDAAETEGDIASADPGAAG
jgi:hypothetical protein